MTIFQAFQEFVVFAQKMDIWHTVEQRIYFNTKQFLSGIACHNCHNNHNKNWVSSFSNSDYKIFVSHCNQAIRRTGQIFTFFWGHKDFQMKWNICTVFKKSQLKIIKKYFPKKIEILLFFFIKKIKNISSKEIKKILKNLGKKN